MPNIKIRVKTTFKNSKDASFLARDIAQHFHRGQGSENRIETVLNQLRSFDTKKLTKLSEQVVQAYTDTLINSIEQGNLAIKTAINYIEALNRIIEYTNKFTKLELDTVSAKENGIALGHREFDKIEVPNAVYQDFRNYIQQQDSLQHQALTHSVEIQKI